MDEATAHKESDNFIKLRGKKRINRKIAILQTAHLLLLALTSLFFLSFSFFLLKSMDLHSEFFDYRSFIDVVVPVFLWIIFFCSASAYLFVLQLESFSKVATIILRNAKINRNAACHIQNAYARSDNQSRLFILINLLNHRHTKTTFKPQT